MKIGQPTERIVQGYRQLLIPVDDGVAVIGIDLKRNILSEHGAVFLGADYEDTYSVDIPAIEENGQPAMTLRGFTDDKRLVGMVREWLERVDA